HVGASELWKLPLKLFPVILMLCSYAPNPRGGVDPPSQLRSHRFAHLLSRLIIIKTHLGAKICRALKRKVASGSYRRADFSRGMGIRRNVRQIESGRSV